MQYGCQNGFIEQKSHLVHKIYSLKGMQYIKIGVFEYANVKYVNYKTKMAVKMASTGKGDTTVPRRAAIEACNLQKLGVLSTLSKKKLRWKSELATKMASVSKKCTEMKL